MKYITFDDTESYNNRKVVLAISLLYYINEVESIDLTYSKNDINLLHMYGIATNNQFLINSSDSNLYKLISKYTDNITMFTKDNIIKLLGYGINTLASQFIKDKGNYRLPKAYNDIEKIQEHNNYLRSFLLESENTQSVIFPNSISLYELIIKIMPLFQYSYRMGYYDAILSYAKSIMYSYIIHTMKNVDNYDFLKLVNSPIYDIDSINKSIPVNKLIENDISSFSSQIFEFGSYTKMLLINIHSLNILNYMPTFANDTCTFNSNEVKSLLHCIIAILLLTKKS